MPPTVLLLLYPSSSPIRFVSLYGTGNHISDSLPPSLHSSIDVIVLSSYSSSTNQKVISYFLPSFCLFDSRAEQAKYDPTLSATSVYGIYTRIFFSL